MTEYPNGCDKVLNNPMEIKYINWKNRTSNRLIIPIKIWYGISDFHKGAQWFLRALDLDKNENRDFAIKDILGYITHEEED
jgi:predicted DNA-binding transcriptional regulator YafY